MMKLLKNVFRDEEGATMTEYLILLVIIAIVAIALVTAFGEELDRLWNEATEKLGKVKSGP